MGKCTTAPFRNSAAGIDWILLEEATMPGTAWNSTEDPGIGYILKKVLIG